MKRCWNWVYSLIITQRECSRMMSSSSCIVCQSHLLQTLFALKGALISMMLLGFSSKDVAEKV
eukprot:1154373-Pelagomonas_calceolata.AAC.2